MSPIAIVETLIEALGRLDRAAVADLLAEDIDCIGGPIAPAKGREATMALLEPFIAVDAAEWQVVNIAANGNVVFTERIDRFRFPGKDWSAIPAAGVFEVRDGKIAAWRDYFDLGELERAMA